MYAYVVLDFCKKLRDSVGEDEELYRFCRGTLGSMVEHIMIGNVVSSSEYEMCKVSVKDIFGFVVELANKLLGRLIVDLSTGEARKFASFLRPTVYVMRKHNTLDDDELKDFFEISCKLCVKISYFLTGLKEGMPIDPCLAIIKLSKRMDCRWVLELKDLLDYECRRGLVMKTLPCITYDFSELQEDSVTDIDRTRLLSSSFEIISNKIPDNLRKGFSLRFMNEDAWGTTATNNNNNNNNNNNKFKDFSTNPKLSTNYT
ncbi:E3 ubiquitin-protein ligase UPL5-like [Bidens hawaiensis]|uniref:E3 ubiquitin-protein ligase UPL5-like n=1 Tax=Bidens hawaiensis TaxID=980011 RepID=UPI00404B2CFF